MTQFDQLRSAAEQGLTVSVLTLIAGQQEQIGQMLLLYPDGRTEGCLADAALTQTVLETCRNTSWNGPVVLEFQGGYRIFWDRLKSKMNAVILGGGHISLFLAQLLSMIDFEITVVDDRPEFANTARFPMAGQVICAPFTSSFEQIKIDEQTAVFIVTRGHRYDLECLKATIGTTPFYWGMIGSRRRIRSILDLLTEEGTEPALFNRLKAPIGLDIGSQTPAEIAVSVVAEVLSVLRGASCMPLSTLPGKRVQSSGEVKE
ncbi:XdhC family protein [Lucifera butyrica]|uniref:XdhC family protein n=1 Tax=Lucifera butyrica TaxID=1351585 RepID=UPI0014035AF8|nr:XdhC family protein [Lucifera butyrica]